MGAAPGLSRERDESLLHDDEAVPLERAHGFSVEPAELAWLVRDEPEGRRPALAERALERPLLAGGLLASPARRALSRQRTDVAARDASEADRGPEIHERLRRGRREVLVRAAPNALDVHVHREHVIAEREAAHCRCRVRADARKRREVVRPALERDDLRGAVQVHRAPVVAEPLPLADRVGRRRRGERSHRRPPLQPREVERDHAVDLRLLKHDLRDEDRVRVTRATPREIAAVHVEPREEERLHAPIVGRQAVAAARSCFEKYVSAAFVFVSCLPSRLTPFPDRKDRASAATWNASTAVHFVESSRIRDPSG